MSITPTVLDRLPEKERLFFAFLRAGLWEQDFQLLSCESVDYDSLYSLADEQSVVGLIGAGMEHITDTKVQKMQARPFLKRVFSIEQRNTEMNKFLGKLVSRLRENGVFFILIKGQGVAQCYSRPLWRASGDIDLLLDSENYEKAKTVLVPIASHVDTEGLASKHLGMTLDDFTVELHGSFPFRLSKRGDKEMDAMQYRVCSFGEVRVWHNAEADIDVFLPSPDNDVLIIFTHFLRHFYKGGIGLRQICDWCRLLWTYRDSIDRSLLQNRIDSAGLLSEWKAFAAFAVDYLGMPSGAMPMYDTSFRWSRKARLIQTFIIKVGNFGHNRNMSYFHKYPYFLRKAISACQRVKDGFSHMRIFPWDSIKFMFNAIQGGVRDAVRGE